MFRIISGDLYKLRLFDNQFISGAHENIITVGDLSDTYQRPNGDQHACGDPSEFKRIYI